MLSCREPPRPSSHPLLGSPHPGMDQGRSLALSVLLGTTPRNFLTSGLHVGCLRLSLGLHLFLHLTPLSLPQLLIPRALLSKHAPHYTLRACFSRNLTCNSCSKKQEPDFSVNSSHITCHLSQRLSQVFQRNVRPSKAGWSFPWSPGLRLVIWISGTWGSREGT